MGKRPLCLSFRTAWLSSSLIVCLVLLSSCSVNRGTWGEELRDEDVKSIMKGDTRADVLKILGAPDRIVEVNGHEILQYYRYEVRAMAFAPLIAFSRAFIASDDLYVFLNKEAVVDDIVFGRRTHRQEYQFWPFGD
jgi:outer membrane protein assembly factor BamE (lipoprotein component of BamABCDE complex)